MARPIAGSRRPPKVEMTDGALAVIALVPSGNGVEVRIDNRVGFEDEDLAVALRDAADKLEGKHDRAKGMW